jgi:hypothetical protein
VGERHERGNGFLGKERDSGLGSVAYKKKIIVE